MLNPNTSADNKVSTSENADENIEAGIMLNCTNALDAIRTPNYVNSKEFLYINRKDYWHKVTVLNAAIGDKEAVLKQIMDFVHPADLIPVMVRDDGINIYFLIRRCGQAIEKLCRVRMTIENTYFKLNLQIILGFAHVNDIPLNMQDCLNKVIRKRYDRNRKLLDLSNFHKDPELVDILYCPLSQGKILNIVLNISINSHFTVRHLSLANNDMSFIRSIGSSCQLKQIIRVDLRQNLIRTAAELVYLRQSQLQELLLDLNPVCENYDNEHDYIEDIRKALPSLIKLDGVRMPAPGFPRFIKNFILSQDDIPLADQFIRQYFTLYDSKNRMALEGLYHEEALFSLSATYLPGQSTSNTSRLTEYAIESRNLLKLSDYSKNLKLLHQGPKAILGTLCKLPLTEHDPYFFTVDIVQCNYGVMLSVKGIFKEPTIFKSPLIRSFCRAFVLVKVGSNSYQIANETMHITNATTKEVEAAFKIIKPVITPKMLASNAENLDESEKNKMADTLTKLTTMNTKWSRKCLEEIKWDIKEALMVFTELYKMNKIPEEAFS